MNILEMQLIIIWHFTNTVNGCKATLKTLDTLKPQNAEELETVNDAKELVFAKGNLLTLEGRA